MKQIRIRLVKKGESSPWIYLQEEVKQEMKTALFQSKTVLSVKQSSKTNQYGRFRYSNMQYGKIEKGLASSIEVIKAPLRIKYKSGDWAYLTSTTIEGACPAIRIKSKSRKGDSPWVYIQDKEV